MTDGIGTTSYGYHAVTNTQMGAGQLASEDGPLANDTIIYTYDALGRTKSQAINGIAQPPMFDTLGRVEMGRRNVEMGSRLFRNVEMCRSGKPPASKRAFWNR